MAAIEELQETVAVPEPVTLVGVRVHVIPVAVSVRLTAPANPLSAVIVMVEVAEVPTVTAAGEDAAIVKSRTVNVAVVE